jgi:hypothetical protein
VVDITSFLKKFTKVFLATRSIHGEDQFKVESLTFKFPLDLGCPFLVLVTYAGEEQLKFQNLGVLSILTKAVQTHQKPEIDNNLPIKFTCNLKCHFNSILSQ